MKVLADLMVDCEHGGGRVVLVRGAAGTGKTTLLQVFGEWVAGAGVRTLHATGSKAESGVALGVVRQLFGQSVVPAGHADEAADETVRRLDDAARATATDPAAAPPWPVRQLFDVVVEQIRCGPVLIGVDDAQYADAASLQFLSYLLRRLAGLPVLVVLTESAGPNCLPLAFRAELLRHPRVRSIRLAPLSTDGVAELLRALLDDPRILRLARCCAAVSGGNPLLVRSFAEDHRNRPEAAQRTEPAVGEAFTQAVLACVYPGEPAIFQVASCLAVLGELATETLVARLADMTVESVLRVVRALSGAGLIEAGRFRHPALASAVSYHLPARDRADLHRKAAQLLHDGGAAMITVARHLIAAGRVDFPWACAALHEAATEALRTDDIELALQYVQAAHRLAADDRERAAVTLTRLDIEWRNDPYSADRWLAPLVGDILRGRLVGTDATRVVRHLVWLGRTTEAASCLASLSDASDTPDPHAAVELQGLRQWLRYWCPPLVAEPGMPQQPAARTHIVLGRAHAVGLLGQAFRRGADDQVVGRAEEVLQGSPLDDATVELIVSALQVLTYADRYDLALPWCESLLAEATTRRAPTWQALLSSARAEIAVRQGDPATAERMARAALRHISERGWGIAIGAPLSSLVQATTMLGMKSMAVAWLNHPVPEAMFQTPFGLRYLHARGSHQLAAKRPAAAVEDFLTCGELLGKWELDLPGFLPWRTGAAQAYLDLGEIAKARTLVREQLSRPGARLPRTRATSLRLLAAVSPLERRPALLREAQAALENYGDRTEQVRVLADLSRALQELGVADRARAAARRAWSMAKDGGTEALCRSLLPQDVRTRLDVVENVDFEVAAGADSLTNSERAVAGLAAAGHTNREIARKLRITVSTVEQHLTRVYRKLHVRRRNELPAVLQLTDPGHSGVA